jgi:hypothetical protein
VPDGLVPGDESPHPRGRMKTKEVADALDPGRDRCDHQRGMRLCFVCIALWLWSSAAAAEISFVRDSEADEDVASQLEQLIGQPVSRVGGESHVLDGDDADAALVSIDREHSRVHVASLANPAGLSRELDSSVVAESPYAVALAAAELLDWLDVLAEPAATSAGARSPRAGGRSGRRLTFGVGFDFELQAQLAQDLAFARPALNLELAFDRGSRRFFWTVGARVSAPLGRDVDFTATRALEDATLRAQAMDAAVQLVGGYELGALALTAHAAAGAAYLRVVARDAEQRSLGSSTLFSPLVGAGLGARLSVAYGFALSIRGEAQWAGPPTVYRIDTKRVLDVAAVRFGLLAGLIWESALGWGER